MEEILASIRRIISEDAAPPKPQPIPVAKPTAALHQPSPMFDGPRSGFAGAQQMRRPEPPPMFSPATVDPSGDDDEILDLGSAYAAVTRSPPPAATAAEHVFVPLKSDSLPEVPPTPSSQIWADPPLQAVPEPILPLAKETPAEAVVSPSDSLPEHIAGVVQQASPAPSWSIPNIGQFVASTAVQFTGNDERIEPALEMPDAMAEQVVTTLAVPEAPVTDVPVAAFAFTETDAIVPEPAPAQVEAVTSTLTPTAVTFQAIQTQPSAGPLSRTLEDTVADLLKPMLREWLDTNMPRIVEKVLAKSGS